MRTISMVCSLLFAIFSFVYLYIFQADILETLHFSLAHGRTVYAPFASSMILTIAFMGVNFCVSNYFKLEGKFHFLSYIPSFIFLVSLTDIRRGIYSEHYSSYNYWLYPLMVVVCLLFLFLGKRLFSITSNSNKDLYVLLNSNLSFLLLFFLLTIGFGNSDADFHHEIEMEHQIRSGNMEQALEVGEGSLQSTRTLTALRAMALAQKGELAERMFEYPQYYGSNGLIFPNDPMQVQRYTNETLRDMLGVDINASSNLKEQFARACHDETGKYLVLDYYLCSLLLDRKLDTFVQELDFFVDIDESLPKYYKEAIVMYKASHADCKLESHSGVEDRYKDYCWLKQTKSSSMDYYKQLREQFSETYWWYYDFGSKM